MCFSAESSFTAAALLIPAGGYCLQACLRKEPRFWAFATIPLGFGLQQAAEGLVWLGVEQQQSTLTTFAVTAYLLFAIGVWPCWFPLAATIAEPVPSRKRFLFLWMLAGSAWLWLAWAPVLLDPFKLHVEVVRHSLHYTYADNWFLLPGPTRWFTTLAYLICTAGPMVAMTEWRRMLAPLGLGGVSVAISGWFYGYAYTSVWCFFAATLSLYCVYFFSSMSTSQTNPSDQRRASEHIRPV